MKWYGTIDVYREISIVRCNRYTLENNHAVDHDCFVDLIHVSLDCSHDIVRVIFESLEVGDLGIILDCE